MTGVEAVSEAALEEAPAAFTVGDSAAEAPRFQPVATEPPAQSASSTVSDEEEAMVAIAPVQPAPRAAVAPVAQPASVEPFVLPTTALEAVAQSAGLEWVNSDAEKIRAVQEAMAREPKPVHVPREPKPVIAIDEGPLVLVETRKDLTQFKLPFETQASQQPQA